VLGGGTIAPGTGGTTTGILRLANGVTFGQGSTFQAQLQGTTAGTNYDQLLLTAGNVMIAGDLSVAFSGFSVTGTEKLFIINNTGAGTLNGTFANAGQGAVVATFGGFDWYIVYGANADNGDLAGGNDIVLTPIPEPAHLLLVAVGGMGFLHGFRRWRRRKVAASVA
jgi:hypothetical protein